MQFISDVHVDMCDDHIPPPPKRVRPVLALLGDIGSADNWRTEAYIYSCCELFELVLWVPGNHELWPAKRDRGRNATQLLNEMYKLEADLENLMVLHNKSITLNNYKIIGTTLWSHVPVFHEDDVQYYVRDYKQILDEHNTPLCVAQTNLWHSRALNFLQEELSSITSKTSRAIILTHHPPLKYNINQPEYAESRTNAAYSNNLLWLLQKYKSVIHTWAWGHTHWRYDVVSCFGSRLCSNPVGYHSEKVGEAKVNEILF